MGIPARTTMILVLLDESGSMSNLRTDVIGSINKLIAEQKAVPEPAYMGIAAFTSGDSRYGVNQILRFIRPVQALAEVKDLTLDDYSPSNGTPLLDATGKLILQVDELWRQWKPDRCIFATFTDGQENESSEFTKSKIKTLVEAREKSGKWVFQFLGANIDSFHEGSSVGYASAHTANYQATPKGFAAAAGTVSHSFTKMRNASDQVYADYAVGAQATLGGNIGEDGSLTAASGTSVNSNTTVPVSQTAVTPPPGQPPVSAMQPEAWKTQASSALLDPKITPWEAPQ